MSLALNRTSGAMQGFIDHINSRDVRTPAALPTLPPVYQAQPIPTSPGGVDDTFKNTQGSASWVTLALGRAAGARQGFADRANLRDVSSQPPLPTLPPIYLPRPIPTSPESVEQFKVSYSPAATIAPPRPDRIMVSAREPLRAPMPATLTRRPAADLPKVADSQASVVKRDFHFHAPLVSISGNAPAAFDPDELAERLYERLAHEEQIAEERA